MLRLGLKGVWIIMGWGVKSNAKLANHRFANRGYEHK